MSRVVNSSVASVSRQSVASRPVSAASRPSSRHSSRSTSAAAVSRRSRSAGVDSTVAFGRTSSVASSKNWSSSSRVADRGQPQPHRSSHAINVDELAAVDVLKFGGSTGSVRLMKYSPSGVVGSYITPYSQRDPVSVTVENGTLSVHTGTKDTLVCVMALEQINKVDAKDSTLSVHCQTGQYLGLSIHSATKLAVIQKLLKAKSSGVIDDTIQVQEKGAPSTSPRRPQVSSLTAPLTRTMGDPLPQGNTSQAVNALSPPAKTAAVAPESPTPTNPGPVSNNATPSKAGRDARRDVLYAQLRVAKEKRLGLHNGKK